MVTGVDLVEWQLRVASSERLPKTQEELRIDGHAVEARIYAEDAGRGFLPAIGTLHHLAFPAVAPTGAEMRVETGVRAGDTITPWYDPMIAKLVVSAGDRKAALAALVEALEKTEIAGSTANVAFLAALAADGDFAAGHLDTGLIARKQEQLTAIPTPGSRIVARAALAAAGTGHQSAPDDPWDGLKGYAHFHGIERRVALWSGGEEIVARVLAQRGGGFRVGIGDGPEVIFDAAQAASGRVVRWPGHVTVFDGAAAHAFAVADPVAAAEEAGGGTDALAAPMPGLVRLVHVAQGDQVAKGQPLVVLEAMKMEHSIAAPHEGEIAMVIEEGRQVTEGTVLVRFAALPAAGGDPRRAPTSPEKNPDLPAGPVVA
ncbi:MAG: 3-methylcrotonyl-CoA carboxylase [Rhizobiaceae bacterium]|nr:3-methylcrotonyl-CoA carboxylase [Rhizobiaceae bacterium]